MISCGTGLGMYRMSRVVMSRQVEIVVFVIDVSPSSMTSSAIDKDC